jgi:hypothetical protein
VAALFLTPSLSERAFDGCRRVVRVHRVVNPLLWQRYNTRCADIAADMPPTVHGGCGGDVMPVVLSSDVGWCIAVLCIETFCDFITCYLAV